MHHLPRFVPALRPSCPVTRAPERSLHTLLCPREDVAASAHRTPHDYRLSNELIVHWNEGMMWRKSSRCPLAVNQQSLELAVHHVLFHLRARVTSTTKVPQGVDAHRSIELQACKSKHITREIKGGKQSELAVGSSNRFYKSLSPIPGHASRHGSLNK